MSEGIVRHSVNASARGAVERERQDETRLVIFSVSFPDAIRAALLVCTHGLSSW